MNKCHNWSYLLNNIVLFVTHFHIYFNSSRFLSSSKLLLKPDSWRVTPVNMIVNPDSEYSLVWLSGVSPYFHSVFVGTCVCGECTCYDVDPSGDWGDIHGETCECDERSCHAMYDRYSDEFCSGKAQVETFLSNISFLPSLNVVYITFVSHLSL